MLNAMSKQDHQNGFELRLMKFQEEKCFLLPSEKITKLYQRHPSFES